MPTLLQRQFRTTYMYQPFCVQALHKKNVVNHLNFSNILLNMHVYLSYNDDTLVWETFVNTISTKILWIYSSYPQLYKLPDF